MTRKVRPPARGSAPVHPGRGNSKVVRNLRGLVGLLMAGTVALLQGLGSVVLWTSQVTVSGARRLRWPFGTLTTWTMLSGFLAGFQLLACRQYWLGWMGSSLPISLGVTVACLLAFGVSQRRWMRNIGDRFTASDRFAVAQFALAGCVIALPVIATLAGFLARAAGNAILDSTPATILYAIAAGAAIVGVPVWILGCAARSLCDASVEREHRGDTLAVFVAALTFGVLCDAYAGAAWLGTQQMAWIASALGAVLALLAMVRAPWSLSDRQTVSTTQEQASSPTTVVVFQGVPGAIARVAMLSGAAAAMAATPWIAQHLFLMTVPLLCAQAAAVVFGVLVGRTIVRRSQSGLRLSRTFELVAGASALLVVGTVAGFTTIVHVELWLNSRVTLPVWLDLIRALSAAAVLFPMGVIGGMAATTAGTTRTNRWLAWGLPALVYCVARFGLVPAVGPVGVVFAGAAALVAGAVIVRLQRRTLLNVSSTTEQAVPSRLMRIGDRWQTRVCVASSLAATLALGLFPWWNDGFRPELASRLLFSTAVLVAQHFGTPTEGLAYLDDGRLVAQRPANEGVLTAWSFGGNHVQIRKAGIPTGSASTDTRVQPQFSAEILPALLPLMLHERPQTALLLGLGAGVGLDTCLASPLMQITCVESDPSVVAVVDEVRSATHANRTADERVTTRQVSPVLFLTASNDKYDVIVSNPEQSTLAGSQALFTREFYARAAERLAAGGIFCQRFQSVDYGAQPFRDLAATWKQVFAHVMVVELAPGEFAFVGTQDNRGLVREQLLARASAPHVKAITNQMGWDFTVLLTLGAYDDTQLAELAATGKVNSALSGRFAFTLPRELMRWGLKQQELRTALAGREGKLLEWMGEDGGKRWLLRRLSEFKGHTDLVLKYPDQYWAYRSSLREELTKRPRASVEDLGYDGRPKHNPEDQRRIKYLEALGHAARTHNATDIERLAEFAEPFDPLMSFFLHQEIAELYLRARHPDPVRELEHRLHSLYYAAPADRSVLNLLDTIDLLLAHPECEPEPLARFDRLNGLLQLLGARWELRGGQPTGSTRAAIRDVDRSIVATDKGLAELQRLAPEAGIPTAACEGRCQALQTYLVRSLRVYRTRLLPYAGRERLRDSSEGDEPVAPLGN